MLTATDQTTVPCNNDLLAGNFIEDGDRMWLIDYEYSGNNDPCFELGNTWCETGMSTDQLDDFVAAYYGRRLRNKTARAHLQGIVGEVRLDTVGLHTERLQRNRIRLLGLGDGTL